MPQFTFHGFRYAELTGLPAAPAKDAVTALVLHTDAPFTAKLETGSAMINQLWSNILWGQRSNFVGVPTDCPQRDERLGWMGDAQVFWRAASYNMDLAAFSRKFAGGHARHAGGHAVSTESIAPGTVTPNAGWAAGWSDAGVIIPWTSWLQTGDTSDHRAELGRDGRSISTPSTRPIPTGLWKNDSGTPFGDWLSPEGKTDYVLIATAYWAYDATLMRQMAHATGRTADEEKYDALFEKIRAAFQKQFVHEDGFVAGADNSPVAVRRDQQSQREEQRRRHADRLRAGAAHEPAAREPARGCGQEAGGQDRGQSRDLLGTGFLGTPYLLEELTKAGYAKLAYKLLLNTQYPSWGYLVEHGATTMWERWNGDQMQGDPSMNSYNHYAYGAVADWIYRYAAGIDASPLDAGFHTDRAASVLRCAARARRLRLRLGLRNDSFRLDGRGQRSRRGT